MFCGGVYVRRRRLLCPRSRFLRRPERLCRKPGTLLDVAGELRGEARIGRRCELEQPQTLVGRDLQATDEIAQTLLVDGTTAREILELLVGVGQTIAAHDGLDGFGQHFPATREVGGDRVEIRVELAESLRGGLERDQS